MKPITKTAQAKLLLATGRFDHLTIAEAAREMGLKAGVVRRAWRKLRADRNRRVKSSRML